MLLTPEEKAAHQPRKWDRVSVSQVKTYQGCARQWGFDKLFQIKAPQKLGPQVGSAIHTELEHYLKTGEIRPGKYAKHVRAVADHLPPAPVDPATQFVERQIKLPTYDGGPELIGFQDFVDVSGNTLEIVDFKTSKDIRRYAKTATELKTDPQMMTYAYEGLQTFPQTHEIFMNKARVTHIYVSTDSNPKTHLVTADVYDYQLVSAWEGMLGTIRDMQAVADSAPADPEELPPNWEHCGAYGGCYYRNRCGSKEASFIAALFGSKETTEEASEMNLLDKLKAKQRQLDMQPIVDSQPQPVATPVLAPDAPPRQQLDTVEDKQLTGELPPEGAEPPKTTGKKRGRPGKATAQAAATDAEPETPTQTFSPATSVAAAVAAGEIPVAETATKTVYVDCRPCRGRHATQVVDALEWLAPFKTKAEKTLNNGLDYRLMEFGKGKGVIASTVRQAIGEMPEAVYVSTRTDLGALFFEAIASVPEIDIIRGL